MTFAFSRFRIGGVLLLGLLLPWTMTGLACADDKEGKVELKDTKFADLLKTIEANKGKVVIVDVWGDF
jgi:hypothetical protein